MSFSIRIDVVNLLGECRARRVRSGGTSGKRKHFDFLMSLKSKAYSMQISRANGEKFLCLLIQTFFIFTLLCFSIFNFAPALPLSRCPSHSLTGKVLRGKFALAGTRSSRASSHSRLAFRIWPRKSANVANERDFGFAVHFSEEHNFVFRNYYFLSAFNGPSRKLKYSAKNSLNAQRINPSAERRSNQTL